MLNNQQMQGCEWQSEMPAYIYREMAESSRHGFESHLLECPSCIDELAGMSDVRFSVLEWQLGEFAEMPTPHISITYDKPSVSAGWLAGLRDLASLRGLAYGSAIAAALLITVAFGYVFTTRSEQQMTHVTPVAEVKVPGIPHADPSQPTMSSETIAPEKISRSAARPKLPGTARSETARSETARSETARSETARANKVQPVTAADSRRTAVVDQTEREGLKKPVLSSFDDDEDNSLRLTDLLEEGGV